ncbi:MAG: PEP-CTERM sorting domain-containing protein, partial [Planctomycetes bacterium]|nr:PEP-CTERM sorting domain-containing protein [Planctomycetota bacterium]
SGTPEPATVVSSLIGLAAAAGYRLRRRDEKKGEPKE